MIIYRNSSFKSIKEGITLKQLQETGYFDRHPGAIVCTAKPLLTTLDRWVNDGIAKSIDGCKVEPDGTCQHGAPSWLLVLGYI